jgi:uncharacterized protein with HEPN domain
MPNKFSREWLFRIQDILKAIDKIMHYVKAMTFSQFKKNELVIDAAEIPAGNLNEGHHRAHRDHREKSNEILCDLCVLCGVNFTEKFAIRFNLTTSG